MLEVLHLSRIIIFLVFSESDAFFGLLPVVRCPIDPHTSVPLIRQNRLPELTAGRPLLSCVRIRLQFLSLKFFRYGGVWRVLHIDELPEVLICAVFAADEAAHLDFMGVKSFYCCRLCSMRFGGRRGIPPPEPRLLRFSL